MSKLGTPIHLNTESKVMISYRFSYVVKDGDQEIYYRKTISLDKPKCWVEGFQYHFNWTTEKMATFKPSIHKKDIHGKPIKPFYTARPSH